MPVGHRVRGAANHGTGALPQGAWADRGSAQVLPDPSDHPRPRCAEQGGDARGEGCPAQAGAAGSGRRRDVVGLAQLREEAGDTDSATALYQEAVDYGATALLWNFGLNDEGSPVYGVA
jgi:hypothetical protein